MTVILDQAKHSPGDCAINPVSGCAGEQSQILILAYTSGCMRSAKNHLLTGCRFGFWRMSQIMSGETSDLIRNDGFAFLFKSRLCAALIPRIPKEYTAQPATWAGFVCEFFGSATPGMNSLRFFLISSCTACNPCTDSKKPGALLSSPGLCASAYYTR